LSQNEILKYFCRLADENLESKASFDLTYYCFNHQRM
jgi:hypothetical protein